MTRFRSGLLALLAAAVAAGSMLTPTSARAQDAPGSAESLRAVVRLSPTAFPQLPRDVRRALAARGCTIPQSSWERKPHNVVRGRFTVAGQSDWAVLCAPEGRHWAFVLVFRRGSARDVDSLAAQPLARSLLLLGTDRWVYERHLSRATPAQIREMANAYSDPLPRCLDHDALNDAPSEKSSVVWYWLDGRWRDLGIGGTFVADERQAAFAKPCARK